MGRREVYTCTCTCIHLKYLVQVLIAKSSLRCVSPARYCFYAGVHVALSDWMQHWSLALVLAVLPKNKAQETTKYRCTLYEIPRAVRGCSRSKVKPFLARKSPAPA